MIVIPAVDIRGGMSIGPTDSSTAGGADAYSVVRTWSNAGFQRVHVADLDASAGTGSNVMLLEDLIRDSGIDVQAEGGVEAGDLVERLLDAGASRVILGPRALDEPDWLAGLADAFPGCLVVRTDIRERRVVTRGWVRSLPIDVFDLIDDLASLPLGGLLVSAGAIDDSRDASELALLEDVAESCSFPVIAVDGVTSMNDLRALEHRGVSAVVIGKALIGGLLDARAVAQEFSA